MTETETPKKASSTSGKITRRSFLIGSAAVVGGVAFGAYAYNKELENPLETVAGETTLNPYLIIDQSGFQIVTPRAEMGQGVHSTMAALVAEELDVPWDQVRAIHGPPSSTYYNSMLFGLTMPFMEYNLTGGQRRVLKALDVPTRFFGIQVTAGSTSITEAFDKLRIAGAAARQALLKAAAKRLDVDLRQLRTQDGFVIGPNGSRLAYKALAEDAARIKPATDPKLKAQNEWRYLGKSMPRKDIPSKVDGSAEFGIDVRQEDMLFASVRLAPRAGLTLLDCDVTKASAMPGVKKAFTLGNEGVAVIATNTWYAIQAVNALEPQWSAPPAEKNNADYSAAIKNGFKAKPNSHLRNVGDVDAALKEAPDNGVVTASYSVPYLAHAPLEPLNATALYTGQTLELWTGHQGPTMVRTHLSELTGLGEDAITVHTLIMGGSFGRRGESDYTLIAAQVAMQMPGSPVKTTYSREEDTRQGIYRPAFLVEARGAASADGVDAFEMKISGQSVNQQQMGRFVGFVPPGEDKLLVDGAYNQPYSIPNYSVTGHLVDLPVPVGSWRSVGGSHNTFFHEAFLDELIHAGGHDPVEMRLTLMRGESDVSVKVLETAAQMAGWGTALPRNHARGVAFSYFLDTPIAAIMEVSQNDGMIKVEDVWCAADIGPVLDPRNAEHQIVSGIMYGLSSAIMQEINFENGEVVESNFTDYDALRIFQAPRVHTQFVDFKPDVSGVGEASTPVSIPALTNAIFALTGKRYRDLPLNKYLKFV